MIKEASDLKLQQEAKKHIVGNDIYAKKEVPKNDYGYGSQSFYSSTKTTSYYYSSKKFDNTPKPDPVVEKPETYFQFNIAVVFGLLVFWIICFK